MRRQIEMVTCHIYGEPVEIPKVVVDEMTRLRAMERQHGDEERDRLMAAWVEQHGPLPQPPDEPMWVPVEHVR